MDYGKLKTYYESIDRVTVPFVYPQYWDKDKEEWVVVDKDNRLPVDARLTGSNVAETIDTDFIITAGNTMGMGILELDGVNQISIGLRLALAKNSPDIKIFYRWRSRAGLLDNSRSEFEYEVGNEGSYIRMLTKRLTLVTNSVAIYIENSGNQDVEASSLEVFKYV